MSSPNPRPAAHPDVPKTLDFEADSPRRDASTPLSGPGATRQNKKLQLRKAGFRGQPVPTRNVTPTSNALESWSSRNSGDYSPRLDERSPSGTGRTPSFSRSFSNGGGILQEVSNSSLRRKDRKPRAETLISIFQDENGEETDVKSTASTYVRGHGRAVSAR